MAQDGTSGHCILYSHTLAILKTKQGRGEKLQKGGKLENVPEEEE